LVFNKIDIFRSKLKSNPLKNFFSSYDGGDDEEKAIEFIKNLFLDKNKFAQDRIHVFVSQATDKDSISNVIKKMTDLF
jgi:coenzyme F420-reducing hydrogenase delta subunit